VAVAIFFSASTTSTQTDSTGGTTDLTTAHSQTDSPAAAAAGRWQSLMSTTALLSSSSSLSLLQLSPCAVLRRSAWFGDRQVPTSGSVCEKEVQLLLLTTTTCSARGRTLCRRSRRQLPRTRSMMLAPLPRRGRDDDRLTAADRIVTAARPPSSPSETVTLFSRAAQIND